MKHDQNATPANGKQRKENRAKKFGRNLALCFLLATTPTLSTQATAQNTVPAQTSAPAQTTIIADARPDLNADIAYVQDLHLAYIISPSDRQNTISERGLNALGDTLYNRTAVEPSGVIGLDIERADLTLFPFIYWPISSDDTPISAEARQRVQDYVDNGGVILFDVRDASASLGSARAIADVVGPLRLSPLEQLDDDHTLTRSFYLLSTLRGTYNFNSVWVEDDATSDEDTETLTNVIIGQNNWASAWAGLTVLGGSENHEMSLRAGVNMVMYALTGNYKSDAMQMDEILERLERNPLSP